MAITRGATKALVLANGRIEFNQFPIVNGVERQVEAKGFRYLGSSKELNLTQENETLEHKSSECGFNTTDEEIITSSKLTGSFTLDNINTENLAMFFAGEVSNQTQVAATGKKDTLKVYPSLGYRLGTSKENPNGVFSATITKIEVFADEAKAKAGTPVESTLVEGVDFEYTPETGFLMIGDTASTSKIKAAGSWIVVTYDLKKAAREVIISKGQSIVGEFLFRGCNAKGENRQYWMPKVRLSPNGDFALKGGEEWSSMAFNITALESEAAGSMLYINGQPTSLV